MRYGLGGLVAVALVACACGTRKPSADERAVTEAIHAHLGKQRGLALNNMKTKVESVSIQGDTAEAQVRFQSTQKPELAVAMRYILRRAGGQWEVESSSPVVGMGTDSHQAVENPGGAPAPRSAAPPPSAKPQPEASH